MIIRDQKENETTMVTLKKKPTPFVTYKLNTSSSCFFLVTIFSFATFWEQLMRSGA